MYTVGSRKNFTDEKNWENLGQTNHEKSIQRKKKEPIEWI